MGTRSFIMSLGGSGATSLEAVKAEQDRLFLEDTKDAKGNVIDKSGANKQRDLGQTISDPELELRKKAWAYLRDITPLDEAPGGGELIIELRNWKTWKPEQPQEPET